MPPVEDVVLEDCVPAFPPVVGHATIHIKNVVVEIINAIKLLEKEGWYEVRQSGSHKIFRNAKHNRPLSVPYHGNKDLAEGTLNSILKQAGLK